MHIILKGTIDLLADTANKNDKVEKHVAFKNNAPFRSCISKINNTLIGNAEDLDIVMLMYNLLEYNTSTSIQPPVSPEEDQAPQPPIQP